jgi:uncharacterized protein (AIM24 family)
MIKLLRKLQGKRTHIANTVGIVGTGLVATGLDIDPVQLAAAAGGSVDAVNNIVTAWDAGRNVNWQQVGIGGALLTISQALVYVFRALAAPAAPNK